MRSADSVRGDIADLRQRVVVERRRARRAAEVAVTYQQRADGGQASQRALRHRLAELHRRTEQRHLASARVQAMHADRLQGWLDRADVDALRPTFISAVAASLFVSSAAMTLVGPADRDVVAAFSDGTARSARDLELVVAEGPISDATSTGSAVAVAGLAITEQWPRYGPALAELGVCAVVATPLRLAASCLGALCVYGRRPGVDATVVREANRLADALTHTVLAAPDTLPQVVDPLHLFDDTAGRALVHQAAGMVSVRSGCGIDDAIALLRAHAFSSGLPVDEVARQVVEDGDRLG